METEIMQKIIEKQDEIISNLRLQLIAPEPTTFEAEGKYTSLLLTDDRLTSELASLKSQLAEAREGKKEGWTCPRCGKVHSYLSLTCDCPPKTHTFNTCDGTE